MRNLVIFGVMAAVLGLGMTAFAADTNQPEFYAMSEVAADNNLQAMSDSQLTKVEGMSRMRHHDGKGHDCKCGGSSWTSIFQSNSLSQANLNFGGKNVYQANVAEQSNFAVVIH